MKSILLKGALVGCVCLLGACAPVSPPLYYWGNYQPALYQHHQNGVTNYDSQISAMEAIVARAQAQGQSVPPGLHAHLGMLYFNTGREPSMNFCALAFFDSAKSNTAASASTLGIWFLVNCFK